jgi:hypothetical protein
LVTKEPKGAGYIDIVHCRSQHTHKCCWPTYCHMLLAYIISNRTMASRAQSVYKVQLHTNIHIVVLMWNYTLCKWISPNTVDKALAQTGGMGGRAHLSCKVQSFTHEKHPSCPVKVPQSGIT